MAGAKEVNPAELIGLTLSRALARDLGRSVFALVSDVQSGDEHRHSELRNPGSRICGITAIPHTPTSITTPSWRTTSPTSSASTGCRIRRSSGIPCKFV